MEKKSGNWELRFFFENDKHREVKGADEIRTDIYIVATESVGIKLRGKGGGLILFSSFSSH